MNHDLVTAALGAGGALVVGLATQVVTEGLTRRRESRAQRAADQAALQAQADELYAAVLALNAAGSMHDQLMTSGRKRLVVLIHAAAHWIAEWARSEPGANRAFAGLGKASTVIGQWDREQTVSAAGLTAPLTRLGAAVAPLARHPDRALADAAVTVFETVTTNYQDTTRGQQALRAFRTELLRVLNLPASRRWRILRRDRSG
ncbi:hypothetical protein ABT278_35630 [Streptomyces sp. NPDC001228]|uniref:hypothetical protein n=1 Tax=unclassified Streptomyces TaxID=2593676 RepID=UPI0033173DCD